MHTGCNFAILHGHSDKDGHMNDDDQTRNPAQDASAEGPNAQERIRSWAGRNATAIAILSLVPIGLVFWCKVHPSSPVWKLGTTDRAGTDFPDGFPYAERVNALLRWELIFFCSLAIWFFLVLWYRIPLREFAAEQKPKNPDKGYRRPWKWCYQQKFWNWSRQPRFWALATWFVYLSSEFTESFRLSHINDVRGVNKADLRWLAYLNTTKLLALACTALWVCYAMGRRLTKPTTEPSWRAPDSVTCLDDTSALWTPRDDRFAVSVSGGGIRSASFALGAIQVLQERRLFQKARWITAVSGGAYLAGALVALNQPAKLEPPVPPGNPATALDPDAQAQKFTTIAQLGAGSPELQHLRRNLRYLVGSKGAAVSALARISIGLLFNLFLVYLTVFAVVRPVGWLIGTPLVQRGLRIEQAVGDSVHTVSHDPDIERKPLSQSYRKCDGKNWDVTTDAFNTELRRRAHAIGPQDPSNTSVGEFGELFKIARRPMTAAYPVSLNVPAQCVAVRLPPQWRLLSARVRATQATPAIVSIVDGKASIERQPEFTLLFDAEETSSLGRKKTRATPDEIAALEKLKAALKKLTVTDLFVVQQPTLKPTKAAVALPDDVLASTLPAGGPVNVSSLVEVDRPLSLAVKSNIDRRLPVDVDVRHWLPGVLLLGIAIFVAFLRITWRPPGWFKFFNKMSGLFAILGLACLAVSLALPMLVEVFPARLVQIFSVAPSANLIPKDIGGLSSSIISISPIVGWLFLTITSISKYTSAKQKDKATVEAKPRNAKAFASKIGSFVRRTVVGVGLVTVLVVNAVTILTVGAMNGPHGRFTWLSDIWWGGAARSWLPPDLLLWMIVVAVLMLLRIAPESMSWSPGPVYKRRLAAAFAMERTADGTAEQRQYGDDDTWSDFAPRRFARPDTPPVNGVHQLDDHAGFADGKLNNGTEAVICCAANVLGDGWAPSGRRAVSFTVSRSVVGGPEVGYMRTNEYVERLGKRRCWDLNVAGMVAISGAAVSPAMGKSALGPIGSVYALLNVRLGAWLPHPQWVRALPPGKDVWNHNPGWTWFAREVLRRYKALDPYLFVTDGGHWENLGLVEAIRRGCKTIVTISAAGDGELSHATFAEAVEIARTDLGVEISLDGIWNLRPAVEGETALTLPSGRQYILEPSGPGSVGRVAPGGFAFGSYTYPDGSDDTAGPPVYRTGMLLLIEATMIDGLPVDVHAYAEGHPEFPNVSTADQFLTDRDFESYRMLGRIITEQALESLPGLTLRRRVEGCTRAD